MSKQVPFYGEVATSPAMVEVYTLGAVKGLGMVARPLVRGAIRSGVSVGAKTLRFAKIPISKIPYIAKLGNHKVVKRSYQWAAHGYKFGTRLAPGGAKQVSRIPFKTALNIFGRSSKIWVTLESFFTPFLTPMLGLTIIAFLAWAQIVKSCFEFPA